MSETSGFSLPLEDAIELSGLPYPPYEPHRDITFAIVVWNDAGRLDALLRHVRPHFETLAVVVQESPDDTLQVARNLADIVMIDNWRGYGDKSFGPILLPQISTRWTFKCDADEWPDQELLDSLHLARWDAQRRGIKGVWVRFRSWIEDNEYEEQHSHLRLFETEVGWPSTLHSRPPVDNGIIWTSGHIHHRRSLDEMILDYLSYYRVGKGNVGWDAHNKLMMRSATSGVAKSKGWSYVKSYAWWPDVLAIAYDGVDPENMTG